MSGRDELDKEYIDNIIDRIKGQPDIIKRYYYWLPKRKAASTKKNYINSIIRYAEYLESIGGNISDYDFLSRQKKSDINAYADTLLYKKKKTGEIVQNGMGNVCLNLYALKNFYDFLCDEEVIENTPFLRYDMPKNNKENPIVALDKKEITKVKKNILWASKFPERDEAIFVLGIRTGLRVSAIISINTEDVDFYNGTIRVVEKGNIERYVYIGEDTINVLKIYYAWRNNYLKKDIDAFFIGKKGERITYYFVSQILKKGTKGVTDKHITPHKMRATCATNIYKKTGDIYLTADVLGHKNLSNTRKYAKIDEENKRKAASILDNI